MNEIIEELRNISSDIGADFNDLYKIVSGDSEKEEAEQRFYRTKNRYKIITIIIFVICSMLLFLKFYIL